MDFYDRHSAEYADRSYTRDLGPLLEPFCRRLRPGGRILDLGSGAGRDSQIFARLGFAPVSLDRSRAMLREHRRRGGVDLVQADLAWLPFRSGLFDGVWACASLLHIPKGRLVFALNEARRVLRPEGFLFVSVKAGAGEEIDAEGRHWAYYEADELAETVVVSGFLPFESVRTRDLAGRDLEWISLTASPL